MLASLVGLGSSRPRSRRLVWCIQRSLVKSTVCYACAPRLGGSSLPSQAFVLWATETSASSSLLPRRALQAVSHGAHFAVLRFPREEMEGDGAVLGGPVRAARRGPELGAPNWVGSQQASGTAPFERMSPGEALSGVCLPLFGACVRLGPCRLSRSLHVPEPLACSQPRLPPRIFRPSS
jgi:hypothetical protein